MELQEYYYGCSDTSIQFHRSRQGHRGPAAAWLYNLNRKDLVVGYFHRYIGFFRGDYRNISLDAQIPLSYGTEAAGTVTAEPLHGSII
jgi:hypothetical protein